MLMKTKNSKTKKSAEVPVKAQNSTNYDTIKLGIDWHAHEYRVVRIIDNGGPESAQRFKPHTFLNWVGKQLALAKKVYTCYEAGAGGFCLHRQLVEKGVSNYVVTPRNLDRDHKRVVNDATDARELSMDLDRYVRGNRKALRVVWVPTPEQEQRRQQSRQRKQLQKKRLSVATQGRMLLLGQGHKVSNQWWKKFSWERLSTKLEPWLLESLEVYREIIEFIDLKEKSLVKKIQAAACTQQPVGLGRLTSEELDREVCDWNRIKNPKSAGSFAGLTGGLSASGDYHCDLPITKAGNRRLRTILIELAWRWVRYQSQSPLVQRWSKALLNPKAHRRGRKRAIVALARQLWIELWRWRTGRKSPEELGWRMAGKTLGTAQAA
jgi:transposase